jgi:hypothetical protein
MDKSKMIFELRKYYGLQRVLYTVVLLTGIRLKRSPRKLRLCTSESNSKGYDCGGSKWSRI